MNNVFKKMFVSLFFIVSALCFTIPEANALDYPTKEAVFQHQGEKMFRFLRFSAYTLSGPREWKRTQAERLGFDNFLEVNYDWKNRYVGVKTPNQRKDDCPVIDKETKELIDNYSHWDGIIKGDFNSIGKNRDWLTECFNYDGDLYFVIDNKENPSTIYQDINFLINKTSQVKNHLSSVPYDSSLSDEENRRNIREHYVDKLEYTNVDLAKVETQSYPIPDLRTFKGFIEGNPAVCQSFAIGLGFVYNYYDLGDYEFVTGTVKPNWTDDWDWQRHSIIKNKRTNKFYDITWQLNDGQYDSYYSMSLDQAASYMDLDNYANSDITLDLIIENKNKTNRVWSALTRQENASNSSVKRQVDALLQAYDDYRQIQDFFLSKRNADDYKFGKEIKNSTSIKQIAQTIRWYEVAINGIEISFRNMDFVKENIASSTDQNNSNVEKNDISSGDSNKESVKNNEDEKDENRTKESIDEVEKLSDKEKILLEQLKQKTRNIFEQIPNQYHSKASQTLLTKVRKAYYANNKPFILWKFGEFLHNNY